MAEIGEQRRVARDVGSGFELRLALLVPADEEVVGQWRLIAVEQREGGQDVAELGGREVVELRKVSEAARRIKPGVLRQFLHHELRHELEMLAPHRQGAMAAKLQELLHGIGLPLSAVDMVESVGQDTTRLITSGLGVLLGMVASIKVCGRVLEQLGWTKKTPDARMWPFLWVYGRNPKPREIAGIPSIATDIRRYRATTGQRRLAVAPVCPRWGLGDRRARTHFP